MKTRIVSIVLTVFFLISLLPAVPFAEEVSATYVFSNGLRGDGEGTLTFEGINGYGKVCLYFTTEYGLYEDCEPVAVQTVSSMRAVFTLPRAFLLPPEVTGFALFYEADAQSPALENACAVYALPEDKLFGEADPAFTFASVSDVHVNYDDNGYGASKKWTNALDFFDLMGIDSVVISGDITGSGTQTEYNRYRSAVSASYVAPERIYEAQGNHDATQVARFLEYTQGEDDVHPFEGSAWFYVLKEGENGARDNLFIFMAQELSSTSATPNVDNFSTRQLDWVEGLLETYAGTDTNIFIIEHAMIRNFGPGDKYNGVYVEPMYFKDAFPGNMRFKSLLTTYKEAIMMSGHTHLSLREGYNFGDENGTAARMIHNSSISQPRSYTSSGTISYNSEGRTTETAGSEGYLVYVYDDCATYVGYDLTAQKIIPTASYLIPLYSEDRASAQSIAVTAPPVKTVYDGGECFDAAGMVVTATYADGTTAEVKGWGLSKVGALSSSDKSVSITYGNCAPVAVPITVAKGPSVHGEGELQGSGTETDPFLVSSAADFAALTKCFNASTSSGGACGTGKFYRQTADIDMTGYPSYEGTHANGDAKCYFAGIYDGAGHTLTVNIKSSGQTSVFPYIYGAIINLKVRGSINSDASAQPIRTVQSGAVVANCVFEMTLTSSKGNGVSYSIYGTLLNVYVAGVGTKAVYSSGSDGKYYNVFTNMKSASDSPLTHSTTTASDDLDAIAAAFNDRTGEAFTNGIAALSAN
ncbi:MAG: metallophosphoesterase, partial [Clostridia bacterium]|nr:metallophosphoesterase [Clostridia bacterium]